MHQKKKKRHITFRGAAVRPTLDFSTNTIETKIKNQIIESQNKTTANLEYIQE